MLKILLKALTLAFGTLLIATAHAEDTTDSGDPVEVCKQAGRLYYWHDDLKFDCSSNYIHIFAKEAVAMPAASRAKVRIGSFNLFHLGDGQAPMKRLGLLARMMNQWDIVAAQELMPVPGRWMQINREVVDLISSGEFDDRQAPRDWRAFEPGYLQLLNQLRELDSSWSLILQPVARSEMVGFYYRSSHVRLKTFDYCAKQGTQKNLACSLDIPARQRRLMSRNAFAAYFEAGGFDFIGVTTHVRFRPSEVKQDVIDQETEICENFAGQSKCDMTKEKTSRFYEVKAIADQFPALRRTDEDILFMGDFNLEITRKNSDYWNASLNKAPGFQVFQEAKTSLSIPYQNLASNYDHFVLNPQVTTACDVSSISTYDFTRARELASQDSTLRELRDMLSETHWRRFMTEEREKVASLVHTEVLDGAKVLAPLGEADQNQLVTVCEGSVERMRANDFGAYMELVSDHVPISITCATGR